MDSVTPILDQPCHLMGIDRVVRTLFGKRRRRGWVLVNAGDIDDHVWVHARPFLLQPELPPGFAITRAGDTHGIEALLWLQSRHRYALVLVRDTTEEPLPEPAVELMEAAAEVKLPLLMLVASDHDPLCYVDLEGRLLPLPSTESMTAGEGLPITLRGLHTQTGKWYLPLDLTVRSAAARAEFEIELLSPAGFDESKYAIALESPDNHLGEGHLVIEPRLEVEGKDGLVVAARGFTETPAVHVYSNTMPQNPPPNSHWQLHLLFDRTTLDVDAWPAALAASRGLETEMVTPTSRAAETPEDASTGWNRRLRKNLVTALPVIERVLQSTVDYHLWWFADVPRNGIERYPSIAPLSNPFEYCGRCPGSQLSMVLESEQLAYSPGYDLFDAADEALSAVARTIQSDSRSGNSRRVAVIVGDSPPPPRDFRDPLWQELVAHPTATNARCSPHFQRALAALAELGVPVAWLFVRSPRTPEADGFLRHFCDGYPAFQTLKERALMALDKTEGLIVEATAEEDDLQAPLLRIFKQVIDGSRGTSRLEVVSVG